MKPGCDFDYSPLLSALYIFARKFASLLFLGFLASGCGQGAGTVPLAVRISPADGMTMVFVPAGPYSMGSGEGIPDARDDEKPLHVVELEAFWMDQTEVTTQMYAQCVDSGECTPPHSIKSFTSDHYYGDPALKDYPVINVDWVQAQMYCEWAGERLPTEAEWEKAACGTDNRLYPWGNQPPGKNRLNYDLKAGSTTRVGSYPAGTSPFGALDMGGNVWEWVADRYDPAYYAVSPLSNPSGPGQGDERVIRGGSLIDPAALVRCANRDMLRPGMRWRFLGFRCAQNDD